MDKEIIELASGLQHSNINEISKLAKAYLELNARHQIIQDRFIQYVSEQVMDTHHDLLKKLED